ncbi:MAG: DUF2029 domain-containing protein [Deltaproteobacteria bacterium]|nr:DUF2029 domain-containing protein [Deltaproteobacteria bacterium]
MLLRRGMPILSNFYWGLVSVLITVLVLGAPRSTRRDTAPPALLLGGAISIKVTPGLRPAAPLQARPQRSPAAPPSPPPCWSPPSRWAS